MTYRVLITHIASLCSRIKVYEANAKLKMTGLFTIGVLRIELLFESGKLSLTSSGYPPTLSLALQTFCLQDIEREVFANFCHC